MLCNIHWNTLSLPEWEKRFLKLRRSNVLQSYHYARAVCEINHQRARFGLIEIDGAEAGMVQILEAGILGNVIHAVVLDRGPLWFDTYGSDEHFQAFMETYARMFPKRWGRKRRMIPEIGDRVKPYGFERIAPGYETIWLDLTQDDSALRAGLKKNWRGSLQKGEKAGLTIEWDDAGEAFAWLMEHYVRDRAAKGYDGPSVKLLQALAKYAVPGKNMLIGTARKNVQTKDVHKIAGVMIITHGAGATYQIGFSSEDGRALGAHHLLLWDALSVLKERGVTDFDLGGINDDNTKGAKGVRRFKEGLGGAVARGAGLFT